MASNRPRLSVVMPARNVSAYVDEAIASILAQSFADFELVIRDDGSTDDTGSKLRGWADRDRRIRLFGGPRLGPSGSSNWVVREARGDLVARMDADDIAMPDRLRRQVEVMTACPDIELLGTLSRSIRADGKVYRHAEPWRVARRLPVAPFAHSSVMFRRAAFDAVGGYRAECNYWEDLDLFLRISRHGRVCVVAEELVAIRLSPASSRAVADPAVVEAAVARMYASVAAVAQGRSYEAIIAEPMPDGRLNPLVFVARANPKLWSGGRPLILGQLLRRGRIRPDWATLASLSWAGIAALAPSLLRAVLTLVVQGRNRAARASVEHGSIQNWSPFGSAVAAPRVATSLQRRMRTADLHPLRDVSALQE